MYTEALYIYMMYIYDIYICYNPKITCKNLLHVVQLLKSVHQQLLALFATPYNDNYSFSQPYLK